MKKIKFFEWFKVLVICSMLITSCITQGRRARICATCPAVIKDSITTVEKFVPFDTTLFLSGYKGKEIYLPSQCGDLCDSLEALMERYNNNYQVTKNGVQTSIKKDKNGYRFTAVIDSLRAKITLYEKQSQQSRIVYKDRVIKEKCTRVHVNFYHKAGAALLTAFLLLLAFALIRKYKLN